MAKPVFHRFVDGHELKECSICNQWLDVSNFWTHNKRRDGLQSACKACVKTWKQANKDAVNRSNRKSKITNKARNDAYNRKYQTEKYKTDIAYRLRTVMCANVSYTLRGRKNGQRWVDLVGYSVDALKNHLAKQFLPGMSWDNYGEWQIDHRIPVTAFNIDSFDCIDFKKCWALKNLRPLWRLDNILKYNHLDRPFQPSLAIAG
jgi:hypothetical protein